VYGVYDVTGDWDSIIIAKFKNRNELNNFVKNMLSIEYVERTNTSVILNIVKEEKKVQL
jgi:DNA-binding Lrp family transcriptional regulator